MTMPHTDRGKSRVQDAHRLHGARLLHRPAPVLMHAVRRQELLAHPFLRPTAAPAAASAPAAAGQDGLVGLTRAQLKKLLAQVPLMPPSYGVACTKHTRSATLLPSQALSKALRLQCLPWLRPCPLQACAARMAARGNAAAEQSSTGEAVVLGCIAR